MVPLGAWRLSRPGQALGGGGWPCWSRQLENNDSYAIGNRFCGEFTAQSFPQRVGARPPVCRLFGPAGDWIH